MARAVLAISGSSPTVTWDTALLFGGILALTVLGIVLFALIGLVERLTLSPYAAEHASLAHETT
jgi:hypothetical protein